MKNIISLILIIAAVWIFWGYTSPIYEEAGALREVRTDYQAKLAQANEFRQKYENLTAQYQSFSENDLTRLSRLVPETVDSVRLVMEVSDIAARQGLSIKNIKINESTKDTQGAINAPATPSATGDLTPVVASGSAGPSFNSVDLNFSITGDYEQFIAFLKDLEKGLRILDVTEIKFAPATGATTDNYDFNLGLRAYWLK